MALFIEFDADSYNYIRDKNYEIEFILGDLDCHGVMTNPNAKPKPNPAPETDSSSASRSGVAAILPANATAELHKLSHETSSRDPRVAKKLLIKPADNVSDAEDGYSTTSSRGSSKYKPPARRPAPARSEAGTQKLTPP